MTFGSIVDNARIPAKDCTGWTKDLYNERK